ncbi:MAG: hypothetical protein MHPSP_004318, partial [Paramarteilia canceri]
MTTDPEKSSIIWKYFAVVLINGIQYSKCTVPDCDYQIKGRHTTTMKHHLAHHSAQYQDYVRLLTERRYVPINTFVKSKLLMSTAKRQEKINELIVDFFAFKPTPLINIDQGANMIAVFGLTIFEEESDSEFFNYPDNEDLNDQVYEQLWIQFDIKRLNCFAHILNSLLKAIFENHTYEFVQFKSFILSFSAKINKS